MSESLEKIKATGMEKHDSSGSTTNHLFPVFLKLEELRVLLVGAGKVGLEKLTSLLTNAPSTSVHIVATEVSEQVTRLAASHGNVVIEKRNFHPVDLVEKDLVIIAINDKKKDVLQIFCLKVPL